MLSLIRSLHSQLLRVSFPASNKKDGSSKAPAPDTPGLRKSLRVVVPLFLVIFSLRCQGLLYTTLSQGNILSKEIYFFSF
jgi:hypothetical protein